MNHPFVDGNNRTGHAVAETFLILNSMKVNASIDEQERIVLAIASGELGREAFVEWVQQHIATSLIRVSKIVRIAKEEFRMRSRMDELAIGCACGLVRLRVHYV